MNIINFNYGDEIVRTVPSTYSNGLKSDITGEKYILIQIVDGLIYLQLTSDISIKRACTNVMRFPVSTHSEGWERWNETPPSLEFTFVDKSSLEEQLQRAIECEDYEQAIVLKHKINQLKNATK